MTTRSHRPDPAIAPWPMSVDASDDVSDIDVSDIEVSDIGVSDIETVDPAEEPDVADVITASGVTLDHRQRRIPVTVWRVAATAHAADHAGGQDRDGGLSPR